MKIISIFTLLWIVLFSAVIEHKFNTGGKKDVRFLSRTGKGGWIQAVVLGVLIGLANYYGSVFPIPAFIVTTVVMIWIAQWYWCNAGSWGDFFLFLLLTIPIGFVLLQAGTGIAWGCESAFWRSFWTVLSNVLVTLFGALLILVLCSRKIAAGKRFYGVLAIIFAALALLHVIFQIILGINWPKPVDPNEATPADTSPAPVAEESGDWWHFYNTEMLADEDPLNDIFFGPEVLTRIVESKIQRGELRLSDIAGKTVDELVALVTPEEVEADFFERVENDPALGAAVIAWFDANLGTRYLGEFYESCKEDWATTMNASKVAWMADEDGYYRTLAAWKAFLSTASSVEVVRIDGGMEDQMYMNPYTTDLIPNIIVMESAEQSGYFLRYIFDIKGKEIFVDYRIDCGFQPINVAKLMKITPQSNPNKPVPPAQSSNPPADDPPADEPEEVEPEGKASGGDPGKVSGGYGYVPGYFGGGGGGNITPTPSNPKDTNKGLPKEEVENDVPSPGLDTNNGVGAIDSEAEKPTNTSPRMAEEQYADALRELITREEHQLIAGDPSTPTTAAPEGTDLVKNADSNEFGGIDVVPPTHDTHLEGANLGGDTSSVRDDPLGDEMACPD